MASATAHQVLVVKAAACTPNRAAARSFRAGAVIFRNAIVGRADDFRWPRGAVNVEVTVAEPPSPDTAAVDAGAKSAKAAQRKSAMDAYAAQRRPRPRLTRGSRGSAAPELPVFRALPVAVY
jgi:hypothetical protein